MPIKPENKKLYPKNWKEIRAKILERADNKCEFCGVPNHIKGIRTFDGGFLSKDIVIRDLENINQTKLF